MTKMSSIGVLVNPIAGFGGPRAMQGTAQLSLDHYQEAVAGARSWLRMRRALNRLSSRRVDVELVVPLGLMGEVGLTEAGLGFRTVELPMPDPGEPTTRADTLAAARALLSEGVDCILFAGGDGTATDLAAAIGVNVPVVGVPSGVKMHSEVFARSPESAGDLIAEFILGNTESVVSEVLDVTPQGTESWVGTLRVPRFQRLLQGAKSSTGTQDDDTAARAIAHYLVSGASEETTWLIGPGKTAGAIAKELGFPATLRGVDVMHPSRELELNVDESRIFEIASSAQSPLLVLGVVGGQGFLLGRGNQQISDRVVDRIGVERIHIVGSERKMHELMPPWLLVDVGDEAPESPLTGYRRVHTGARQSKIMKVVDATTVT